MPDNDPEFLFGPVPHNEAVNFIKSKPVVSREVFDGLLPELKARAFTIAGLEGQANVMETVRDRIAELPSGADWNKTKKAISADISPFLVDPAAEGEERATQEAAAVARAELLLKTHGFQAYQAAQYQVMDRQRDVMPYWQYQTMEDAYVRDTHAALDQIVLPADSPFWNEHFPPWDWGCRCQAIPISMFAHADLVKADHDRASDDKRVMTGPVLKKLEEGSITRNGRTYDVRAPIAKEGGSGFSWDPSTLRLPLEQLEKRYADQPETWKEFVAFAKRTRLGPGQPTVWQWLGGKDTTPPPLPVAPKPPRTVADVVAKITPHDRIDATQAAQVIAQLAPARTVTLAHKIKDLEYEPALVDGEKWADLAATHAEDFLRFIPEKISATLPKFTLRVKLYMGGINGEYDPAEKAVNLSAAALSGNDQKLRETVFHEMTHWVHLEDGEEYKQAILRTFKSRTSGEATKQLPGYAAGILGKKDQFWDVYMGRQYRTTKGDPVPQLDGCEIPARVAELLADPAEFAKHWNNPHDRALMEEVFSLFFEEN